MAGTDESDDLFCIVHSCWMAAEQAVVLVRLRRTRPPAGRSRLP